MASKLNSNVPNTYLWANSGPLREISIKNLSDLSLELSKPLKIKSSDKFGLHLYDFLLIFNINICPHSLPLGNTLLQNLSDLAFDVSRSFKAKSIGAV